MQNLRDHHAMRREDEGPERLEQFRCDMCGVFFLMRATFERHQAGELPRFIEASRIKRSNYEAQRRRYRELYL